MTTDDATERNSLDRFRDAGTRARDEDSRAS